MTFDAGPLRGRIPGHFQVLHAAASSRQSPSGPPMLTGRASG
jgi:hypothetical protein